MHIGEILMNSEERLSLLSTYEAAPMSALFDQKTIAAVFDCSPAKLERDRWEGIGVPYFKIGKAVRYRKSVVKDYLNNMYQGS